MTLPGLSVRKAEVDAVTAIITSDQYETPEKMARAIVGTVMELFEARDWYTVAMRNDGVNLLYGMYGTEGAAQKALEKNDLGLFGLCGTFPVHSATERKAFVADAMKTKDVKPLCTWCGHLAETHNVRRADPSCFSKECRCKGFVKP